MNAEQVTKELERIADEAKGNIASVSEEVKALKAQNQELVEQNEGLAARFQEFEQRELTGMRGVHHAAPRKTLGDQFAESDGFQAMTEGSARNATFATKAYLKSVVNDGADSSGDDAYDAPAQRDPRLANDPRRRLTLLDALPTIGVDSATFEYVELDDAYSNAADEQTNEGDTKAEASLPTNLKSVRPATLAHWLPASEQVLADVPMLQQQIANLLNYGVRAKAENLIVGGNGVISGLEQVGTAFTGDSGDTMEIAISDAQATMEAEGWLASHVIMHPQDWHTMRTRRRGSSDEAFVVGSWMNPPTLNAWGMQVVTSPSVTQGTSIVIDSSQVAILDRQAVQVEAFRQDATNVRENLVTIRAEARIGFAVFAPSAVRLVSTV